MTAYVLSVYLDAYETDKHLCVFHGKPSPAQINNALEKCTLIKVKPLSTQTYLHLMRWEYAYLDNLRDLIDLQKLDLHNGHFKGEDFQKIEQRLTRKEPS